MAVRALWDGPHTHSDFGPPMYELWRRGLYHVTHTLYGTSAMSLTYNRTKLSFCSQHRSTSTLAMEAGRGQR